MARTTASPSHRTAPGDDRPNPLAFEFARKTRDPAFHALLNKVGWAAGATVYPALPGETDAQVKACMEPGRHLLVAADPAALVGMRMMLCEVDLERAHLCASSG